jgi:hypothetical protein
MVHEDDRHGTNKDDTVREPLKGFRVRVRGTMPDIQKRTERGGRSKEAMNKNIPSHARLHVPTAS